MLSRRLFFKKAAVAAAAAPAAVTSVVVPAASGASVFPPGVQSGEGYGAAHGDIAGRLAKLLAGGFDEQLRHDASYVGGIDADLLVMRSISWAAKCRIQKERNFVRRCEAEKYWLLRQLEG